MLDRRVEEEVASVDGIMMLRKVMLVNRLIEEEGVVDGDGR